jgi:phosphoribosylanthranilate isomerase
MAGRTRIKICGMTKSDEVEQAVAAGVDAIGFIFVKESPRFVSPEDVREIIRKLPPFVDAVGVFVNEEPDVVGEITQYCGLTVLQLHGQESPEYCEMMPRRVIKAFQVNAELDAAFLAAYKDVVWGYLLDTYRQDMAGGTGEVFDWTVVDRLDLQRPLILAGGLDEGNVAAAINMIHPFCVDVNSGIETAPGRKDIEKIWELAQSVALCQSRGADGQV